MKSTLLILVTLVAGVLYAADEVPTDIQQPGTQPGEISSLESPNKCDNCHGGYNTAVEPAHSWRGSMMAHAGRDPIFWATLAIAEQDFDGSGDLCLRCHSTGGWLAGRSTPTDGSGLAAGDADGVECDYCHKLTNPDNTEHLGVMNPPFAANDSGTGEGYYGSGMSSMWGGSDKLGPYSDAEARHQFMQSLFHRDVDFCGTCHDVSNPVVGNLAHNGGAQSTADPVIADGNIGGPVDAKAAFNNPPYRYGIVERTFSEYKSGLISQTRVSDFHLLPEELQGGALQAIYEAATAAGGSGDYEDGTTRYYSCQSCHMRPVTGRGANKKGVPVRTDLPLHDMTGGNYWMPEAIAYLNELGKLRLGGGMSISQVEAMRDGALRARQQLELAASLSVEGTKLRVINHTGHKLISGYPEGRRMWLNIKWYDGVSPEPIREDGAYGPLTNGNGDPVTVTNPANGELVQVRSILDLDGTNTKIYESHHGLTPQWASQLIGMGYPDTLVLGYDRESGAAYGTLGELAVANTAHESFHFVLNNTVVKDNRIPPYGMQYDVARVRNALPVPVNQYGGGTPGSAYNYWDEVSLNPPAGAEYATIDLLYQPTSWEYIQFLYLANDGQNAFLADEGANMLEAWLNTGMAEPHIMVSATWGNPPVGGCQTPPPVPTLLTTTAGDKEVHATWQPVEPSTTDGYRLYYDQGGKAQLVVDQASSAYTDTELTNGIEYCYKVTSYYVEVDESRCESEFSNVECAVPATPGQAVAGVAAPILTGKWVREGKGKNATTTFVLVTYPDPFAAGDGVVIQGNVVDKSGAPLAGATVQMDVRNQSGATVSTQTSGPSDSLGRFELTWQTQRPNKKGQGGTPAGDYTAVTTGVSVNGYSWDGATTSVSIMIQ